MNLVACDNQRNLSESYENITKTPPSFSGECKGVSFTSFNLKILIGI